MIKKEIIWRHVLHHVLTKKGTTIFTQKELAQHFKISTSTVFNALKAPRKLGAIEVTGRFFRIRDALKLLLLWATHRTLSGDIVYSTYVDMPVMQIEASMPDTVIFAAWSAYRLAHGDPPADYSLVYVYSNDIATLSKRFPKTKGDPNLFVLKPDQYLHEFGSTTPDVQTFVDLWNIPQWYAKDFLDALKKKMNL